MSNRNPSPVVVAPRPEAVSREIVAEIALYGTHATGAGWLARHAGQSPNMVGDATPKSGRYFTEAVREAMDAVRARLRARNIADGFVRIYDAGGQRFAEVGLCASVPVFSALTWQAC